MSKVVVTGCAGFLGSHLCEALFLAGHSVVGVDSMLGGERDNVHPSVDFHPVDCANLAAMKKLTTGCEVVYHLAAAPHEGLSVFSPCVVTRNTYLTSVTVAAAAAHCRVRRVVFASSMSRYGGLVPPYEGGNFPPFVEASSTMPVDPYGIAKVASEQVLLMMGRAHGFEVVIAVPHNIYGPRQRYCDPYRNVVGIFVNQMLQGKPPYVYGDGRQVRCFSYIDDCVPPLLKMGFEEGLAGEVINIGPDSGAVTVNELATVILGELRSEYGIDVPPFEYLPERPCEVKVAYCSSARARRLLGYEAKTSLADGIKKTVAWIRERGTRPFDYHLPVEVEGSESLPRTWGERLY